MANLNITLAVTTSTKKCVQTGIPSIRETVNFVFTGLTGTSASNLRLFLIHNGTQMANCATLTASGANYVASTNLNTIPLIALFGTRRTRTIKDVRIQLQDVVQDIDFLNDEIEMLDHPYQDGMADPVAVTPIGGVEYAPLASFNEHVDDDDIHVTSIKQSAWSQNITDLSTHTGDSTIHVTSGDKSDWDGAVSDLASHTGNADIHFTALERAKLSGIETGAEVNDSAAEIKGKLETLTTTGRLDADYIKDGATNLFLTDAERTKLSGIETGAEVNPGAAEIKSLYESNPDTNAYTNAEKAKLAAAPGDNATVKSMYEANADTNAYTDAEQAKLAGIEAGATADQTATEIRTALETLTTTDRLNADSVKDGTTNLFLTDAERTKLAGIEAGAEVNPDAAEIKSLYESNSNTNAFTDAYKAQLDAIEADPAQSLLSDNATANVELGLASAYQSFLVFFQINNTVNFITGQIAVHHNGTNACATPLGYGAYPADISGVTFDADVSSGTVRLKITLTGIGSALRMTHKIVSKLPVYTV